MLPHSSLTFLDLFSLFLSYSLFLPLSHSLTHTYLPFPLSLITSSWLLYPRNQCPFYGQNFSYVCPIFQPLAYFSTRQLNFICSFFGRHLFLCICILRFCLMFTILLSACPYTFDSFSYKVVWCAKLRLIWVQHIETVRISDIWLKKKGPELPSFCLPIFWVPCILTRIVPFVISCCACFQVVFCI